MSVEIYLSPSLQNSANGLQRIEVNGKTVGECLEDLIRQYPRLKILMFTRNHKLHQDLSIFINGENAYPGELAKTVKDGDRLNIVTFFVGG